jgi:hypothetical protein
MKIQEVDSSLKPIQLRVGFFWVEEVKSWSWGSLLGRYLDKREWAR